MKYDTIPRTCYPHSKIEEDCYDWWARHARKCEQAAAKRYDLIFIGDSITHFWHDERELLLGEKSGWFQPLQNHEKVWQEFYGKRSVLNLGYGFDRPQNVLYRLEHGEFLNQQPKVVVLNIGTNCFSITPRYDGDTPEIAFAGVRTVIEKIFELSPASRLVLMEIFPRLPEETQQKINELNRFLREYAKGDPRITTVSLADKLADENGVLIPDFYCDRCTHLNAAGYRIWAEAIEPYLREI